MLRGIAVESFSLLTEYYKTFLCRI